MVSSLHAVFLALCSLASASPMLDRAAQLGPAAIFESVDVPGAWKIAGPASSGTQMTMQIGLKQNNIAGLQSKLLDISDPKSANYGKWLSKTEMEAYTSPSAESVQIVKTWLEAFGIPNSAINQPTPDWMEVSIPLAQAETMLNTKYSTYVDSVSGSSALRTNEYSLPLLLHDHVNTIQPSTAFHRKIAPRINSNSTHAVAPKPLTKSSKSKRQSSCDPNNIIPSCIQSYYNVDYTGTGQSSLAVTAFNGVDASHEDGATFLRDYAPNDAGSKWTDVSVSGGSNNDSNPQLEGNLDTQYALGLGYPNPVSFLAVGPEGNSDQDFSDALVNLGTYLNSASSPPSAVSTSYGGEEQGFSSNYLDSICNEFMKAGSLGISIFFSSGDHGVAGNGEQSCKKGFYVIFPASCPYVTAVGATEFNNGVEETAAFTNIGGGSGGGFSNYFSLPSYQGSVTTNYINGLNGYAQGYFNHNGRGYPDVALVGELYDIILNGQTKQVEGTSCSSPAWASLISQINDYRISQGQSTLGFLNPLLYSANSDVFNDITTGNNYGCGTDGFPAAVGWDATTGLGSMNFANLRQAVSSKEIKDGVSSYEF